ncbi:MAG TPA: hypothetical protein VGB78_02580 [Thermoplasmata archaeon]
MSRKAKGSLSPVRSIGVPGRHAEPERKSPIAKFWLLLQSRSGIAIVLAIAAFATRLLPLYISSYPYNNDSLTEGTIASDILSGGHLEYPEGRSYVDTHSVVTPVYNVLIAFCSAAIGSAPLELIQYLVAVLAVITVFAVYLISRRISQSIGGGVVAGIFVVLLGTFVFLTASGWKESLGIALLVLFIYAYMSRGDKRMLVLQILLLLVIPFVHHLVAAIAYLFVWYLTVWSLFFAVANRTLRRRHILDIAIILGLSVFAYAYYALSSLDRLISVREGMGALALLASFVVLCVISILVLRLPRHAKLTFAPLPALGLFAVLVWDYYNPLFPYTPGSPELVIALIAAVSSLVAVAWFGLEKSVESASRFRAIPIGLLLPFVTIAMFVIVQGLSIGGTQILYRTFDYADIALAVGVAVAVAHLRGHGTRGLRNVLHAGILVALLITIPYAYETGELTGVRHDTQAYEVDCIAWLNQTSAVDSLLQSDERLSYIGMALYDYEKMPWLPRRLTEEGNLGIGAYYVLEDEWMVNGVNAFPEGQIMPDSEKVAEMLRNSNVLYLGGPDSNNIVLFEATLVGQAQNSSDD